MHTFCNILFILHHKQTEATNILADTHKSIDTRYKQWYCIIDNAARSTIGKTTYKEGRKEKQTEKIKELRLKKKNLSEQIRRERSDDIKNN